MRSILRGALAATFLSAWVMGCGDDDATPNGGGGSGGGDEGGGGDGGGVVGDPGIKAVHAPDETTIVIELEGDFGQAPAAANAYELTSAFGGLTVATVAYDQASKTVTLTTGKQKLGVEYTLRLLAPGHPLDLANQRFLSADTATFWATDFTDFSDFQLTARRLGVGEHLVIYASDDAIGDDVEETIAYFDDFIFPIETELFVPAPDRDDNGKIVLLGLDGQGYYGGYFNPVNVLTEAQAQQFGTHSNEKEMLYISVPDLGNSFGAEQVVAHEFSHLLYNENHDFFSADWPWHNEGLAECAVHAVAGHHQFAANYFLVAPGLANGQSLVEWQYANYDQYVQSYVFLTYVASRLSGVETYGDLFQLSGNPADLSAFFMTEIGSSFSSVHLDMLTAVWVQAATGPYGFEGMIDFSGKPQTSSSDPQQLDPFEGVLFAPASNGMAVAGAGPNVLLRGVNGQGQVDDQAPYDAQGGIVIALNSHPTQTQSSGTLGASLAPQPAPSLIAEDRLWMHPPPLKPANRAHLEAWRLRAHGH